MNNVAKRIWDCHSSHPIVQAYFQNRTKGASALRMQMQDYNNCLLPNTVIKVFPVSFNK